MIECYIAVKMSCLSLKPFSLLSRNMRCPFVDPVRILCEGQVVVDLSAQVFKDLNLFSTTAYPSSLSGPERGCEVSGTREVWICS